MAFLEQDDGLVTPAPAHSTTRPRFYKKHVATRRFHVPALIQQLEPLVPVPPDDTGKSPQSPSRPAKFPYNDGLFHGRSCRFVGSRKRLVLRNRARFLRSLIPAPNP